ncbi:MAG: hypothetical protein V8T87_08305 [Victivallales bacterium]
MYVVILPDEIVEENSQSLAVKRTKPDSPFLESFRRNAGGFEIGGRLQCDRIFVKRRRDQVTGDFLHPAQNWILHGIGFHRCQAAYCFGTQTQAERLQPGFEAETGKTISAFPDLQFLFEDSNSCNEFPVANCPAGLPGFHVFNPKTAIAQETADTISREKRVTRRCWYIKAHQFLQRGIRAGFHFLIPQQMTGHLPPAALHSEHPPGRVSSPGFFHDCLQCR